jgi:hypothetical protein
MGKAEEKRTKSYAIDFHLLLSSSRVERDERDEKEGEKEEGGEREGLFRLERGRGRIKERERETEREGEEQT